MPRCLPTLIISPRKKTAAWTPYPVAKGVRANRKGAREKWLAHLLDKLDWGSLTFLVEIPLVN
ncbi:MAG: hypothetical protein EBQ85_07430 [Proteobacteria bacterium]|nr:hypothetical protein [Pseudomonadota bacterium]